MKALIVTDVIDEYFKEDNILNIKAFNVVNNINKLLSKFDLIVFLINSSNYILETKIHRSLELENCKNDFYIYKKKDNKDNLFSNVEFRQLFQEKNIDEIYIVGYDLTGEIEQLVVKSRDLNYKTIVIEDATMSFSEDINKTLKTFDSKNIYFIETWELEEFNRQK